MVVNDGFDKLRMGSTVVLFSEMYGDFPWENEEEVKGPVRKGGLLLEIWYETPRTVSKCPNHS